MLITAPEFATRLINLFEAEFPGIDNPLLQERLRYFQKNINLLIAAGVELPDLEPPALDGRLRSALSLLWTASARAFNVVGEDDQIVIKRLHSCIRFIQGAFPEAFRAPRAAAPTAQINFGVERLSQRGARSRRLREMLDLKFEGADYADTYR